MAWVSACCACWTWDERVSMLASYNAVYMCRTYEQRKDRGHRRRDARTFASPVADLVDYRRP
jgi:hypothetical protein